MFISSVLKRKIDRDLQKACFSAHTFQRWITKIRQFTSSLICHFHCNSPLEVIPSAHFMTTSSLVSYLPAYLITSRSITSLILKAVICHSTHRFPYFDPVSNGCFDPCCRICCSSSLKFKTARAGFV